VRAATIAALRENGGPAGIDPLVWAVTNWTQPVRAEVREEALDGLAWLRHPDVPRQAAVQLMTRPEDLQDADAEVLRRLADASGPEATQSAIDDLIASLREGLAPERAAALLVVLAPESVDALLELLDEPEACESAALALGSSHDSRAVEPLCTLLAGADDTPTRRAAAWALGEIRDLGAAEALLVATGDGDYEVRAAASAGFDKLGNAAIAVALSSLIRSATALNGQVPAGEVTAESVEAVEPAEAPEPAPAAVGAPPAPGPPRGRPRTRVGPVVRRLLGRYTPR
jgi:HEAT repeat protein